MWTEKKFKERLAVMRDVYVAFNEKGQEVIDSLRKRPEDDPWVPQADLALGAQWVCLL